eukprot:m.538230 g.538230  ORF g.538230 m.538230 type:complete len:84 (+) comp57627_c0_seq8:4346-4597(+)
MLQVLHSSSGRSLGLESSTYCLISGLSSSLKASFTMPPRRQRQQRRNSWFRRDNFIFPCGSFAASDGQVRTLARIQKEAGSNS